MKIKPIGKTRYTINGAIIIARNYKEAIESYLAQFGSGSKIQFAKK
jgi:hypothetical protein